MSVRGPWDRDDHEVQRLNVKLRKTQEECDALKDVLHNKDTQLQQRGNKLNDALRNLQYETRRVQESEERFSKAQEELRRQQLHTQQLEELTKRATEKAEQEVKRSKNLQLELDNPTLNMERQRLLSRINALENELSSNKPSTSVAPARTAAKILELENKVIALQAENTRLLNTAIPQPATSFPLSSPTRPSRNASGPPSAPFTREKKPTRLEQELERCRNTEAENEKLKSKLASTQRDLIVAQNDKLAQEQRSRREAEEIKDLLERKIDEIAELREFLVSMPNPDALEAKVEEIEARRQRTVLSLGVLERMVENQLTGLKNRLSRPPLHPPSSGPKLSLAVPDGTLLQARVAELEARLTAQVIVTKSLESSSAFQSSIEDVNRDDRSFFERRIQELESQLATESETGKSLRADKEFRASDFVPRAEYEALLAECEELEKEIHMQQAALNREHQEKEQYLKELKQSRQNLKAVKNARKELGARVVDLRASLRGASDDVFLDTAVLPKISPICPGPGGLTDGPCRFPDDSSQGELAEIAVLIDRLRTERDDLRRTLQFTGEEARAHVTAVETELSHSKRTVKALESQLALTMDASEAARRSIESDMDDRAQALQATSRDLATAQFSMARNQSLAICAFIALGRVDELRLQTISDYAAIKNVVVELHSRLSQSEADANLLLMDSRSRDRILKKRASRFALIIDASFIIIQNLQRMSEDQNIAGQSEIEHLRMAIEESESRVDMMKANNHEMVACLNDARHSLEAQQTALAKMGALRDERNDLLERCQELEDAVKGLRMQLDAATDECQRLQDSHQAPSDDHRRSKRREVEVEVEDELEQMRLRIDRRTEQIALHQKEIARLETNLTLLEDANLELTSELETKTAEYNHMIADCAEARAVRDAAIARLEALEEEIDQSKSRQLPPDRPDAYDEGQVACMVREIVIAVGRARIAENGLACSHEALVEAANLESRLQESEEARDRVIQDLDNAIAREREVSELLTDSRSQVEAFLIAESQRKQQHEMTSAERDELRRCLDSASNECDVLAAACSRLQDEVDALRKTHTDTLANQQIMQNLMEQLQQSREMVESLEVEKHRLLQDYNSGTEELKNHTTSLMTDYDLKLSNLSQAHESEVNDYKSQQAQAAEHVQALTAECHSLRTQLTLLTEKSRGELEQTIQRFRSESQIAMTNLTAERDLALASLADARRALDSLSNSRSDEVKGLQTALDVCRRRLHDTEEDWKVIQGELEDAQSAIREKEDSIKLLEESQESLRREVDDRAAEAKRLSGMKRFLDQDIKRLEAEVARIRKELKQSYEQAEEHRRRMRDLDITTAHKKSRLETELNAERDKVNSLVNDRDGALKQLETLKNEATELNKAQRKKDVQLHLLKEKLKTLQRAPGGAAMAPEVASRSTSRASSVRPTPSSLAASRSTGPGSSRPLEVPQQNASAASTIINLARSSFTSKASTMTRPTVHPSARLPMMSASISAPNLPLSAKPQTIDEPSSSGKRKREIDDELENRTPAKPIMASPRSPSRLRAITEKGLRVFTPKRPPAKQGSIFTRANSPDDAPPVPSLPVGYVD
ncbi:uncharacterized protein EI90DRAFT_3153844 [Cantharellus anzutake]|uniref:uncharacterized protein n=1 Tax=Cantharellus anzutake TaxID=1750568 RepID=UPI0019055335|nr:uncharacterized protein EI90DRAFT_3153844 [Cantharellus anzutake]KAF8333088.1 hypothetical protein EI90DRAFT_3153844 [Cantharellus anzutake]